MPRAAGMDVVIDPRREGRLYDHDSNPLRIPLNSVPRR